jgi:protein gp37
MRKNKKLLRNCYNFIVNKWLDSDRKERNEGTNQKSNKQTKAIGNLTNENQVLRELIAGERQQLINLRNR